MSNDLTALLAELNQLANSVASGNIYSGLIARLTGTIAYLKYFEQEPASPIPSVIPPAPPKPAETPAPSTKTPCKNCSRAKRAEGKK